MNVVAEAPGPVSGRSRAALSTRGLTKSFVGRVVLAEVDLDVKAGEIHALLGQNGSGKSTLIKCLAGVYRPDAGEISVGGRVLPRAFPPSVTKKFGLAFVHQDLGLALDMTIADNFAIARGFRKRGPFVNSRQHNEDARRVLDFLSIDANPQTLVRDLPVTGRTLVAIGRAVDRQDADELNCLVLDEPTASLTDTDAHVLFDAVRRMAAFGIGVIYVTHRLEEISRLADTVTVLRDGRLIGTHKVSAISHKALVDEILGTTERQGATAAPDAALERSGMLGGLSGQTMHAENISGVRVQDVSLSIQPGEIVGVAGLAGNGRSELCRLLWGAQRLSSGRIRIGDEVLERMSPASSIRRGIAYIPEDRRGEACVLGMSVRENISLGRPPTRNGFIDRKRERQMVARAIDAFDVRPNDEDALVSALSGGNQQKVVIAKWLGHKPSVIILDEPVQGVDVGAKAQIFEALRSAAAAGAAMLVVDSDFDNLSELCNRVLILRRGRIVGEIAGSELSGPAITQATFGVGEHEDDGESYETEDGR